MKMEVRSMLQEQNNLTKLSLTSKAFVHGTLDFFKDAGIDKLQIEELYNLEEYYLDKGYMLRETESIEEIVEKDEDIKVEEGKIFFCDTIPRTIIRKYEKKELYHLLKEYCQKFCFELPKKEKSKTFSIKH